MMKWVLVFLGLCLPGLAVAQPYQIVNDCNTQTNTGGIGASSGGYIDTLGNICVTPAPGSGFAPSSSASAGIAPAIAGSAASSAVLKSSPGNLYGVYATCTSACWLMVFNAVAAPSNGATTAGVASGNMQDCIPIPAGGVGSINYLPPEVFSVGITAAISSTACATLTLCTVGFIHGSAK